MSLFAPRQTNKGRNSSYNIAHLSIMPPFGIEHEKRALGLNFPQKREEHINKPFRVCLLPVLSVIPLPGGTPENR